MSYEDFSTQTLTMYNTQTLIGCTEERGDAWHRRDDLNGGEGNHYPGLIPMEDVRRRLFGWGPRTVEVAYLVPADGKAYSKDQFVTIDDQDYRVVKTQANRVGVLHSETDYDLGVFKDGVQHFPYEQTLIREAERLTGTTLGISTAGVLGHGERAWVEFSMEETLHDPKSGYSYRPNLLKADSMDGSISLTTALTIEATVCMNTLTWNLLEAKKAGRLHRRKHTSGLGGDLQDERDALGILERVDEEFTSELHHLLDQELNRQQRIEVMEIMVPLAEDASKRSVSLVNGRREALMALDSDPMVAEWIGTAWGEVQRYNTFQHWYGPTKGSGRWERNTWRTITGKTAEADRQVVEAIERVLA
jgi:phage/plasmid-like protein (TIGR03299 family)